PHWVIGGVAAAQALAAGEGSVHFPTAPSAMVDLKNKGAPVDFVVPNVTTGLEQTVGLANPSRAPHPCAGELFGSWLASRDGSKVFALGGNNGLYTPYDKLPGYRPPSAELITQKDQIRQLLGR